MMVIASVAVPVPILFVAKRVTVVVPMAVMVPEMRPVVVSTESPAGNPAALKLVGPLVAMILYAKATPVVPVVVRALVITGAAGLIVSTNAAEPVPLTLIALIVV